MGGSTRGSGTRSVADAGFPIPRSRAGLGRFTATLVRRRAGAAGLVIVILNMAVALLAPALSPHDPLDQDVAQRLLPPVWLAGGGPEHLLGTDQLGRDILSRIIHGSRISLLIGFLSVVLSLPFGVGLGLLAG